MASKYDLHVMKKTQDDWHPNFEGNKVRVRLIWLGPDYENYRVCVWGADDFGMEKDFIDGDNYVTALSTFQLLCMKEYVNIADLKKLGFVLA